MTDSRERHSRRSRRPSVVKAVGASALLATALAVVGGGTAAAVAAEPPALTATYFNAQESEGATVPVSDVGTVDVTYSGCAVGPDSITVSFEATGESLGTYPGTFHEIGTLSFVNENYGRPTDALIEYSSTFTIDSPVGQVSGTKHAENHGVLPRAESGTCGTDPTGTYEAVQVTTRQLRYTATIASADWTCDESGISYANVRRSENSVVAKTEGFSAIFYDVGVTRSCTPRPADGDGDGVPDDADNCPSLASPDQTDLDGDGSGDLCDSDDDGDNAPDATDNCARTPNADQLDSDGDGIGNACDATPFPAPATPATKDSCKGNGWRALVDGQGRPFKNQGDCVSYVSTKGRNPAAG